MAPPDDHASVLSRVRAVVASCLLSYEHFPAFSAAVLRADAALTAAIIVAVPYTEIDWTAYMEEVEGWAVDGHTDYTQLKGGTGPLVYPAGFLYVYRALRWATWGGRGLHAIRAAQWCFAALYIAVLALVMAIYGKARVGPPWAVLLLVASKRIHSLFVLRLFNDCVSTALAYAGVYAAMHHRVRRHARSL